MVECISPYVFKGYTGKLTRKNFAVLHPNTEKEISLILISQSTNKSNNKKAYEKVFFQQFSTCLPSAYLLLKWSKTGR